MENMDQIEKKVMMPDPNLVETNIRIIGDKRPIIEVVKLMAYIRHAIRNNLKCEIKVKLGHNIANTPFMFDVNGLEVQDFITKNEVIINWTS